MIWDAEAVARLRELSALQLNSARIAELMGVPRNAVHGARYRYGMAAPRNPEPLPMSVCEPPSVPGTYECRYLLDGGPRPFPPQPQWCMAPTLPGSPYCPEHHARCYTQRYGR